MRPYYIYFALAVIVGYVFGPLSGTMWLLLVLIVLILLYPATMKILFESIRL